MSEKVSSLHVAARLVIGVVSDTHGYLDPRLLDAFRAVDLILHAGDVGSAAVLEGLAKLAPVHAVRGNNDLPLGGFGLPERLDLRLGGLSFHLVHELPNARPAPNTRAFIFGHSHRQLVEQRDGVIYLNPGAAGRVGFHRLQTAALAFIEDEALAFELLELGPRLPVARLARRRP